MTHHDLLKHRSFSWSLYWFAHIDFRRIRHSRFPERSFVLSRGLGHKIKWQVVVPINTLLAASHSVFLSWQELCLFTQICTGSCLGEMLPAKLGIVGNCRERFTKSAICFQFPFSTTIEKWHTFNFLIERSLSEVYFKEKYTEVQTLMALVICWCPVWCTGCSVGRELPRSFLAQFFASHSEATYEELLLF